MVGVVSGCLQADSQPRVVWPGLSVGGRLAPCHIHHINRVNSRSGFELRSQHHKHCRSYYYYYYYYYYASTNACEKSSVYVQLLQ